MTGQDSMIVHRSSFLDISTGNITALSFSHRSNTVKMTPSDLRLALGRSNGDIEIWNPRENWFQELVIHSGKDRSIEGLCWRNIAGESLRLFSIGGSTAITEWNLTTGLPLKNYDCNSGVIWSISINESQDQLAVGCDNGTVVLIDISGGPGSLEHSSILMRQESRVLSLSWNKDDFVIGGCSDGRIRIWSAEQKSERSGRLLHTMKVNKAKKESTLVWSVLYLPKVNQIVSGDSTGSIKFWDFHYATLTQSFKAHAADVLCLASDAENEKVFSTGVDRKIYQFTQNSARVQNNIKWVNTSNRLIHGNDVRAMASYQSKGADFLVSGGVEKSLIISSLSSFSDGKFRRLSPFALFNKNVLVNKENRFVVMWQGSIIKIWNIESNFSSQKNYRLVCKLVLKDEQSITTCAMSPDGQVLIVARPSTTKLFHLQPMGSKLKVTKLDNEILLKTGCRLVQFIDNSRIIACSSDNELFTLDLESENDEEMVSIDIPEVSKTKSIGKIQYLNNITILVTSGDYAIISRGCGAVDLINLVTLESKSLVRLMNFITAICINIERNTVIITTADNKIYEVNLQNVAEDDTSLLTSWSKINTDNLPKQLSNSFEKCHGIFYDPKDMNKVWFWSPMWLARLDLSVNLPINTRKKPKKHTRDGLTITDESNFLNDVDEEDDDNDLLVSESLDILSPSINKLTYGEPDKAKVDSKAFYFNDKFKSVLFADSFSEREIFIVERPTHLINQGQAAYDLPKIVF